MAETTKKTKKLRLKKTATASKQKNVRSKTTKSTSQAAQNNTQPQKVELVISTQQKNNDIYEKNAKTCEISRFFYGVVIMMIILLYAEIVAGIFIFFNYDVQFDCNTPSMAQTFQRIRHQYKPAKERRIHRNIRRRTSPSQSKTDALEKNAPTVAIAPKAPELKCNSAQKKQPEFKCPIKVKRHVAFNEDEYAPFALGGNASIEGKLCLSLKDGATKCFNDATVFINPVTSYSDEWYARAWAGRENLELADERAFKYNIAVQTKADGSFKFENLTPGSYYVGAAVCLPDGKEEKPCHHARFGTKVETKDLGHAKMEQVFP